MKGNIKIRGWIITATGAVFYLLAAVLAPFALQPTPKPNLAAAVGIMSMIADILITVGFIVGIINWFRKRPTTKLE